MVNTPPGGVAPDALSLIETPTWALATVFFIFISLSIFVEYLIHHLCSWIQRLRKTALLEAVEKLKTVLMILGFMSLALAVTQKSISRICIPTKHAYSMLPCRRLPPTRTSRSTLSSVEHLLTSTSQKYMQKPRETYVNYAWPDRSLTEASGTASDDPCTSQGKTSFISEEGVNQLSIFVFVLAVMQIVYSFLTMALGRAKMRRWKAWEKETQTVEYLAANDPNRFRYTRQTTFGRRHMGSCTETTLELWTKCFFRQFFHSVAKVDYLTLRHGFISAHLSNNNSFDFQKYIERSLEDDFKVVVGIRPSMWILVVFFMLLDVHGWEVYLWVSFVPPLLVLILGTKMEVIVAKMALQLKDQNSVIKGAPLVLPNDSLFWFGHPKHVLTLVHFTLFMNSFEVAFFIWVTLEFGIKSCYHEHIEIIIVRVVLPIIVQVLCSYITLPLYALVTQMGSQYKKAVLEEQMASFLKQWHTDVRKKRKKNQHSSHSGHNGSFTLSTSPDVSSNYRTIAEMEKHSTQIEETEIENSVQEIQHIELDFAMISSTSTLDTQNHNVKDQTYNNNQVLSH